MHFYCKKTFLMYFYSENLFQWNFILKWSHAFLLQNHFQYISIVKIISNVVPYKKSFLIVDSFLMYFYHENIAMVFLKYKFYRKNNFRVFMVKIISYKFLYWYSFSMHFYSKNIISTAFL